MDIRALRYFTETVRSASFTQAARTLFVTQSTVSKMIRQLEEEVGTPLLIRDGHRARPTDVGRLVFDRAQEILGAMNQLSVEIREATQLERGSLEVGMPPMINVLFTGVVKVFRERHPDIRLFLREDAGPEIERCIAAGELEIGATVLPVASGDILEARRFGKHAIWAVGPSSVPWAERASLPLSALRDTPLLLPSSDFALARVLKQAFDDAGFSPVIAAQSAHWDFLAAMAAADLGVALLPEPLLKRIRTRGLHTARLSRSDLVWEVGHVRRRDGYLSYAARAWMAVCDEVLGKGRPVKTA